MAKFTTEIIDSVLHRKKEERENYRIYTLQKLLSVLEELSKIIPFKEAYIFGSITKKYLFSEHSDVDIGFIGLDDKDFFKAMSFISERIGMDVDIVQLEHHRLKDIIQKEGIPWKKNG